MGRSQELLAGGHSPELGDDLGTLEGAGSFYQPRTLIRGEQRVDHEGEDPDFFYTL